MVATGFYMNAHQRSTEGKAGYFIRGNRDKSKISCSLMRRFVIIPVRVFPEDERQGWRSSSSRGPCFCNTRIFPFPCFILCSCNYLMY